MAEYAEQQPDCSRCRKKLANQGEGLHGGIGRIYHFLSNKWKPCHRAINSRPRNLRTALEKYFRFQGNYKQIAGINKLQVEARSSIAICKIYFPIFSETIHTILKIFLQHGLRKSR